MKNRYELRFDLRFTDGESRLIEGKAISFETESNDFGFLETIHRGAITQDVIDNSDILFTINHNPEKVVARYNAKKNLRNLDIRLEDDGVYFSFNAPNTTLGNDVLEDLRCGNLTQCSFAFTVADEPGAQRWYKQDGVMYREINKIDALYDLSAVYSPGYEDTYVLARNQEAMEAEKELNDDMTDETVKEIEEKEENFNEETVEETVEPTDESEEETRSCEEPEDKVEEKECEEPEDKEEKSEDETEEVENSEINNTDDKSENKSKRNHNIMNKKFNLAKTILDVAENRSLSNEAVEMINECRSNGGSFAYNGQIQIPYENRALTVTDEKEDVVGVDIYSVLTPLRAKNVAVNLGAKWIGGLTSDVEIPVMSATSCAWASETGDASTGANAFTSVKLSPKRISCYVDLSKLLLIQATPDVESLIYNDIAEALNSKIEDTIFSAGKNVANTPNGIIADASINNVSSFVDILELEAAVENAGVVSECKYAVSPSAKAKLRGMIKGTNGTGMVMENGTIDGTSVESTGHFQAAANCDIIYGAWENLVIGQFGNVDITVDPYTQAANGKIRLVLNAYFDFKVARSNAFAYGKYTAPVVADDDNV